VRVAQGIRPRNDEGVVFPEVSEGQTVRDNVPIGEKDDLVLHAHVGQGLGQAIPLQAVVGPGSAAPSPVVPDLRSIGEQHAHVGQVVHAFVCLAVVADESHVLLTYIQWGVVIEAGIRNVKASTGGIGLGEHPADDVSLLLLWILFHDARSTGPINEESNRFVRCHPLRQAIQWYVRIVGRDARRGDEVFPFAQLNGHPGSDGGEIGHGHLDDMVRVPLGLVGVRGDDKLLSFALGIGSAEREDLPFNLDEMGQLEQPPLLVQGALGRGLQIALLGESHPEVERPDVSDVVLGLEFGRGVLARQVVAKALDAGVAVSLLLSVVAGGQFVDVHPVRPAVNEGAQPVLEVLSKVGVAHTSVGETESLPFQRQSLRCATGKLLPLWNRIHRERQRGIVRPQAGEVCAVLHEHGGLYGDEELPAVLLALLHARAVVREPRIVGVQEQQKAPRQNVHAERFDPPHVILRGIPQVVDERLRSAARSRCGGWQRRSRVVEKPVLSGTACFA